MTKGQKVVNVAVKYLGVAEKGENTDYGGWIDSIQRRWGMGRGTNLGAQPWCGMALDAWFDEAGVSDSGICHPATATMYARARQLGFYWKGGRIPVGALWIKNGVHACLVVRDNGNGSVFCIDGNSSDRVQYSTRPTRGSGILIAIPPAILEEEKPPPPKYRTIWYYDDTKAEPYVYRMPNGKVPRWKLKSHAQKTVDNMLAAKPPHWASRHPRVVKLGGGSWGIQLGDLKTRTFTTKAKRNTSYNVTLKRVGPGRLRKYSKKFLVKEN